MACDKINKIAPAVLAAILSGCGNNPGEAIHGMWGLDISQLPEDERTVENLMFARQFHVIFEPDRLVLQEPNRHSGGVEKNEAVVHEYRREGDDIVVVVQHVDSGENAELSIRQEGEDRIILVETETGSKPPTPLRRINLNGVSGAYVCAGLGRLSAFELVSIELTPDGKAYLKGESFTGPQEKAGSYEIDGQRLITTVDGQTTVMTIDGHSLTQGDGLCVR